jgi:hypothetical protein
LKAPTQLIFSWSGIDPRELCFSFINDDPNNTGIIVYHPLLTKQNQDLIYQLAEGAIYNLLGERSFGTDIRWIDVANLSVADGDNVEGLEELPASIGRRRSAVIVDSKGNLLSPD